MDKNQLKQELLNGYETFDDAVSDALYCNQTEALLHLLNGENVFLSGGAGSGKSYVIEQFVRIKKQLDPSVKIAVTATTGMAALNIGGETIHKLTCLGVNKLPYDDFTPGNSWAVQRAKTNLYNVDVLIIDEISMLSARSLDFVFDVLRDVMPKFPQIVLSGDFTQLPPVATPQDIEIYGEEVGRFCYRCYSWNQMNLVTCYLDKSWRAKEQSLKVILDNISTGFGRSPETIDLLNCIRTTEEIDASSSSILMTTNDQVDEYNRKQQKINEGYCWNNTARFSCDRAKTYAKRTHIAEKLHLKEGDRVMITHNIRVGDDSEVRVFEDGHETTQLPVSNGMIGTFKLVNGDPAVLYTRGARKFVIVFDKPHTYEREETVSIRDERTGYFVTRDVLLSIEQYPLRLAYAISVHKSQGQTLDNIVVDLTQCWMKNLGYVALSRVRSSRDITFIKRDGKLGSPLALLVSDESLAIKEEILRSSLDNRIENCDAMFERIWAPVQI